MKKIISMAILALVVLPSVVVAKGMPASVFERLKQEVYGRAVAFCDRQFPAGSPEWLTCKGLAALILEAEDLPGLRQANQEFMQAVTPPVGIMPGPH